MNLTIEYKLNSIIFLFNIFHTVPWHFLIKQPITRQLVDSIGMELREGWFCVSRREQTCGMMKTYFFLFPLKKKKQLELWKTQRESNDEGSDYVMIMCWPCGDHVVIIWWSCDENVITYFATSLLDFLST